MVVIEIKVSYGTLPNCVLGDGGLSHLSYVVPFVTKGLAIHPWEYYNSYDRSK